MKARKNAAEAKTEEWKSAKKANWKVQVFRVPLPCEVELRIYKTRLKGNAEKGRIIMIDLKKKMEDVYVGAVSGTQSPSKL